MWKLCLHRYRRHLLDAAPVFVVCVKSDSIMFISLSLIRAQSHSNAAFSENSCHLSVTLFVVSAQFVTLLCFKVQLFSEIDFFLFTEKTETQQWVSCISAVTRGTNLYFQIFVIFTAPSLRWWMRRAEHHRINNSSLSQKHYGWLKHLWIRFIPVYYRYQDNLSQSPAYTSNSVFQRFLKTPVNIKNVGNKPFSETTDAFQFHVQRVINHAPHWLYHETVISRSKWHVYYLWDSPGVVCCVVLSLRRRPPPPSPPPPPCHCVEVHTWSYSPLRQADIKCCWCQWAERLWNDWAPDRIVWDTSFFVELCFFFFFVDKLFFSLNNYILFLFPPLCSFFI